MEIQKAKSVYEVDGVTLDDQLLVYGEIQGTIAAKTVYRDLVNTNYTNDPVKGGTVKVRRLVKAISQAYGTARTAGAGNKLKNNYAKVDIDVEREFSEEMDAKDIQLYSEEGGLALLKKRQPEYALGMSIELEKAYFVKLQQTAQANGLVDVSGGADLQDKLTLLIQAAEAIVSDNVEGIDRDILVLTLASKHYDALEKVLTTLTNPISGRTDARAFRGVEVRRASRQGYDAIIQVIGSVAQPVVMDNFKIFNPQFSNDSATFFSYYYGTDAVLPECVLAAALDSDISA